MIQEALEQDGELLGVLLLDIRWEVEVRALDVMRLLLLAFFRHRRLLPGRACRHAEAELRRENVVLICLEGVLLLRVVWRRGWQEADVDIKGQMVMVMVKLPTNQTALSLIGVAVPAPCPPQFHLRSFILSASPPAQRPQRRRWAHPSKDPPKPCVCALSTFRLTRRRNAFSATREY